MIDFIIVGAQKGGTTAASYNLNKHPGISMFSGVTEYGQYEIEFFNQHWERGSQWYFDQLPQSSGIRGEKTAELLHRTVCHERIFKVQPNVKLIILLRCPIERAYSQWRMATFIKKDESRSFDTVIMEEAELLEDDLYRSEFYSCKETDISCWREGYIIKGFYSEQLTSILKYFPKENVHIAISENIFENKAVAYNEMFEFLNVAPFYSEFENRFVGKNADAMTSKTYGLLKEIYSKTNDKLFGLLGMEIKEWKFK
jgi:Sulfotransferase domain